MPIKVARYHALQAKTVEKQVLIMWQRTISKPIQFLQKDFKWEK